MSDAAGDVPIGFRHDEQYTPPSPERVSDVALTTHPHLFEVDPRLMQVWVLQQEFPNWDSLRVMHSRGDHLAWMHRHFAATVVAGSALLAEVEAEVEAEERDENGDGSGATAAPPENEP